MILSTEIHRDDPNLGALLAIYQGHLPFTKDEDIWLSQTGAEEHNGAYRVLSVTTVITDSYTIRKVWVTRQAPARIRL